MSEPNNQSRAPVRKKKRLTPQPHLFPPNYFLHSAQANPEVTDDAPAVSPETPPVTDATPAVPQGTAPGEVVSAAGPSAALPFWAAHTKPRCEKKLSQHLKRHQIAHYLPTSLRRHLYGNRRPRLNWVPLFPGYVFLMARRFDRIALYRTNTVVQFIEVPDPAQLFADLKNLWRTLIQKPAEVHQVTYTPGKPVLVKHGPLKGVYGELVEVKKGGVRLLIRVHFFDRTVSVDIDAGVVRTL
jgi:transcription antitermination factor NusG